VRLDWSAHAIADRNRIFDYIEQDRPRAAISVDDRIREETTSLVSFPERGRLGRVDGTRELVISGTPYIVVYCVLRENVLILRVLHGAQQWPDKLQFKESE